MPRFAYNIRFISSEILGDMDIPSKKEKQVFIFTKKALVFLIPSKS